MSKSEEITGMRNQRVSELKTEPDCARGLHVTAHSIPGSGLRGILMSGFIGFSEGVAHLRLPQISCRSVLRCIAASQTRQRLR